MWQVSDGPPGRTANLAAWPARSPIAAAPFVGGCARAPHRRTPPRAAGLGTEQSVADEVRLREQQLRLRGPAAWLAALRRQLQRALRSKHDGAILALAGPALLSLAADPLLSMVDTAFVGQIGPHELVRRAGPAAAA